MSRIVVALGGNALGNTPAEQKDAVKITASTITDLIEQGHEVVVGHGNGPQVGMISLAFDEAGQSNDKVPYMPLACAGSMTQGYIGLDLQQAIKNELSSRGINKDVVSLITEVEISESDPSLQNPSKPIGSFYTEEEAKALAADKGWTVAEDSGRGWRRMVPSPKPVNIIQKDVIVTLLEAGKVVIAGGGGGIPTLIKDGQMTSVDAVIDKDFTTQKIAELINADTFMIVTAVDGIAVNYGKENERWLTTPSIAFLEERIAGGEWPAGSMMPKVIAAVNFAKTGEDKESIITSLEMAKKAAEGTAGARIKLSNEEV